MVVIGEYHPDMANRSSPANFEESYFPHGSFLIGIQIADIPFFILNIWVKHLVTLSLGGELDTPFI